MGWPSKLTDRVKKGLSINVLYQPTQLRIELISTSVIDDYRITVETCKH